MKSIKTLKILIVLIIIAISMISFVGIFANDKGITENKVLDYKLGMNLSNYRMVVLNVSTATEDVIYDKDGNVTQDGLDEEGNLLEGYTKKTEQVNSDDVLTEENFKICKKVLEKRLEKLGVKDYIVRQDIETGSISVQIPEDENTDKIVSYLSYAGKFEIRDTKTNEVLINNNDVKESKVLYSSASTGTVVFFSVEFNKEGKAKFKDITNTYKTVEDESSEEEEKTVTIYVDDVDLLETSFDKTIDTGLLQLSIGTATTNSEILNSYVEQATTISSLVDSQNMPVQYEILQNMNMESEIVEYILPTIYAGIALLVIVFIYLIVKYKGNGALASISHIGFVALLLLTLRYTNVIISLEAIVAFITVNILNIYFIIRILEKCKDLDVKSAIKEEYINIANLLIPILIIGVTFTFANWTAISSIGSVMFWGLVVLIIYNYIVTQILLLKTNRD